MILTKPPAFWFDSPSHPAARLLAPFAGLYQAAGWLRRCLSVPYVANVPVVCIGNAVLGGAGKTPTALALAAWLRRKGGVPAFVSRGYGGAEPGPLQVDPARHTYRDVGDEPLLLAQAAPCWIARNRAKAVQAAQAYSASLATPFSHLLMDDGLQNPSVKPARRLLVLDGPAGLGNGRVFPAGPLRETLPQALRKADAVVMIGQDRDRLAAKIDKPVLKARLTPRLLAESERNHAFLAFAGIGRPAKFFDSCKESGLEIAYTNVFPDHYAYALQDLENLQKLAEKHDLRLLTTTKDAVRLPPRFRQQVSVLAVDLVFEDEKALENVLNV